MNLEFMVFPGDLCKLQLVLAAQRKFPKAIVLKCIVHTTARGSGLCGLTVDLLAGPRVDRRALSGWKRFLIFFSENIFLLEKSGARF